MIDIRLQAKGRPPARAEGYSARWRNIVEQLAPGDTFRLRRGVLRFEGMHEDAAYVSRTFDPEAGYRL